MTSGLRNSGTNGPEMSTDRASLNSAIACFCASVSLSAGIGGIRSWPSADTAATNTAATSTMVPMNGCMRASWLRNLARGTLWAMWETALAFAIWGSYGSVLTAARIDPALTAIARSAGLGILLTIASVVIARLRGPREITAAIPWRSGALWLSGSVLIVDEVLYCVSAVSGPVAIVGLAYGCVPILAPLLSRFAGTDSAQSMRARHWVCLALAFAGNAMVFSELQSARIHFSMAAVCAFLAGLLFVVMPVCSAKLQQAGLGTWAVLKGQGAVAAILAVPLLALLIVVGTVGPGAREHGDLVKRSLELGAVN